MADSHKIKAASGSTDAVQGLVGQISTILEDGFNGRIINGYGIYREPGHRSRDLRTARTLIEHALAVMDETPWPTVADYDAAAEGH